jgi:hypothetical protein
MRRPVVGLVLQRSSLEGLTNLREHHLEGVALVLMAFKLPEG